MNNQPEPPERSFEDAMTTQEIWEAMSPEFAERVNVAQLQATRDHYLKQAADGLAVLNHLLYALANRDDVLRGLAIDRAQQYVDERLMEETE